MTVPRCRRVVLSILGVSASLALISSALAASTVGARSTGAAACAPGYSPCLPVKSDLNCDDIPDSKKPIRVTGSDRYELDANLDGLGCETAGKGGGEQSPWGLILRKPPKKEATSVKVGEVLTVVGWSPVSMKGQTYELCVMIANGRTCRRGPRSWALKGTVQTFGAWRVARGEGRRGIFRLSLQVAGMIRVADAVRLR